MSLDFLKEQSLKHYTTFGIGGNAKYLTEVSSLEEMQEAFQFAKKENCPIFILGKGSNVVFNDLGFDGLVILNKINHLKQNGEGVYEVGAGFSFSRLGTLTSKALFTGLEFASGIPGSVGGALFMNAGANGQQTSTCLKEVEYLFKSGEVKLFKKEELHFSYRTSSFHELKGTIISAKFELEKNENARKKQAELIEYRTKTQPYDQKSAGCLFKNPKEKPAGRLIEESGLKNLSVGDAFVSEKHANFICNRGNATAKELIDLISLIKESVAQKTGILLEPEVRFIPYEGEF
jgi:UDP-N-acetylmuramate dehydrogenase